MQSDIDNLRNKKVFIFGAGLAGESALNYLHESITVLGFIDNDPVKTGSVLCGYTVFSPQVLKQQCFDHVLIASEYFEQISMQLQEDLNLYDDKVIILPARMLKPVNLGVSGKTRDNALEVLFCIAGCFNSASVNYYVDAGTLLGIHRDGQLIPWDDDLDCAVNAEDLPAVKEVINQAIEKLQVLFGVPWLVEEHLSSVEFGGVAKGAVRSLKLKTAEPNKELPMMDFFVKYVNGDKMDYTLSSRGISMPSRHILRTVNTSFREQTLRFPYDVEAYLTSHYGDWQTPVKDWNLGMIKSATVF